MATHPAQNGCLCEWSGDDHYPQFVKWHADCPMHTYDPKRERKTEINDFLGSAEDYIYKAKKDQANTPMESIHTIYAIRDVIHYLRDKEYEQRKVIHTDEQIVLKNDHRWVYGGIPGLFICNYKDCEVIKLSGVAYTPEKT